MLHPPLLYLQLGFLGTFRMQQILSQLKLQKKIQWNRLWGNAYLPLIHSLLALLWIGEGIVCIQPTTTNKVWHTNWSQELHTAFNYFNNKQQEEHKVLALKVLDTLFDKTKLNSYFDKINFGSKQLFRHMKNPTLYVVILTWLRHLQQCFFETSDLDPARDWNK